MTRWAYVYWGTPVEENVISQIPSQFDYRYRWQSGTINGSWQPLTSTTPGEGFITRVKNMLPVHRNWNCNLSIRLENPIMVL